MEFTLFQFGIKSNLRKLLQNQMYMALMVLHALWKNEDVINVIDHEIIQVLVKDIHYGKTMSITIKKCLIEQDYNLKMSNRTRLQLDSLVVMDMIFS
jgi:hypothetical protein